MKTIGIVLVALVAMSGLGMACVNTAESINWGFTGQTAGAMYYESGFANLDQNDDFSMSATYFANNNHDLMAMTNVDLDRQGNNGNSILTMNQQMNYVKELTTQIDPIMHNNMYVLNGDVAGTMFAGSSTNLVQMGMSMNVTGAQSANFYGYHTNELFVPVYTGNLNANNFDGKLTFMDKFTFDRSQMLSTGAFSFKYEDVQGNSGSNGNNGNNGNSGGNGHGK